MLSPKMVERCVYCQSTWSHAASAWSQVSGTPVGAGGAVVVWLDGGESSPPPPQPCSEMTLASSMALSAIASNLGTASPVSPNDANARLAGGGAHHPN
jgi:hypothetical protein